MHADRERATRRMARALKEFEIEGVKTLIPFHKAIMASEQWARAVARWLDRHGPA